MRTKLFLLIASVLMTVSAMAANFSVGGLYYSITSDNTVQVVAPTTGKYTGDITIPETVTYNATTYRVTAIGDDAFKGANQVTSVTLPLTGITSIGGWAFNDCTGLTSFTIPASVTSIGEKAFYFCDNLQHLYLHSKNPASYNPGNMAFSKIHYGSHVCTLHVPTGCTAAYAADATFSVFTQVAEFDPPQVYELYISGTQVTSLNASDILGDGVASYDASSNTLTVNGNITAPDNNTPCIDSSIHNLTINVASAATLTAYEKTIKIQGITTIIGSAKLTVNETKPIINGTEELSAIYAVVNNLNISNADLHVNGDFYCSGDLKITNSTLSVERYIAGGSDIKITNSAVSVTNGSIMGYISCTLTDCYFKTPQGGYYDTLKKRLVDANGDGVTSVEIRPGAGPTLYNLYVAGTRVTSENASDILGDGVASYDASSNTLTVNGNITAPDNNTPCIDSSIHNLTINVASAATLTAYEKTIKIQGITTIIGSAKLTVNETKPIINGTEELSAIYAVVNNLNISNADLHVNGDFYCSGDLKITNSTLSVERYIAGGSDIKITNSAVSVTNGSIMGYISCTLTDCYFKTPQGGYYDTLKKRLVDANGDGVTSVEIVAEKINLMDNASNAEMLNAYNGETVYVTLKDRTLFKDGKWNTLTLPFNVATLTGTPLEGATVMEMNTAKKNGFDTESGTLYLAFKTATQIEAGKPYLVKWESGTDIVEPVFSDVTISSTTPTAVESTTSGLETVKMVGNYAPVTVKADDQSIMFMGDDNSLYYSSEDRTLRNFRAHFEIPSQKNALALAHNFVLDFDGDVVTNIDGIRTDNVRTVDGWYSLDGRRLDRKPTRKGVYIHNGNKVIVK